jgi:hypothetical protein
MRSRPIPLPPLDPPPVACREVKDVLMSLHGFVGTYCMAPWETLLIWSLFLLVAALACYGAFRQSRHLGEQMLELYR